MPRLRELTRRFATCMVAIAAISLTYWPAQLPALSQTERHELVARFAFHEMPLPRLSGRPIQFKRAVHPNLEGISAWISSVGAAVALSDLDGDGVANDLCYVDTQTDLILITPAPGTGTRYALFALDPASDLTYDRATTAPMGCKPGDMNEDGWMDILVYFWGRTPIAFLHKDDVDLSATGIPNALTAAHFRAQELLSGGERWFTNAATFADVDGDGHFDLIIGNYFPDGAQILDTHAAVPAQMQHSMSRAYNGGHNRILRWTSATTAPQPSVHFRHIEGIFDPETSQGWTLAVGAADLDGDLLPELYFANDFGPDRLLHNRSQPGQIAFANLYGTKSLMTPSSKVLGHDSFKGMGVDFGDLDGDGWLDIFVSNIAAEYALQESHFAFISTGEVHLMQEGHAPYVDRSEELGLSRSGWAWDARLADLNNDGILEALQATGFVKGRVNRWPELHELAMGNDELLQLPFNWPVVRPGDDLSGHQHNSFFVRAGDGHYVDLAEDIGLSTTSVSRGIATADVDGDGDLDMAIANQWETSQFYRNDCPACGAYLALRLLLPIDEANRTTQVVPGLPAHMIATRPAIGASAFVLLPDGRRLVAQVDGGNGHSGARSTELHFGLGQLLPTDRLHVQLHWRDGHGAPHHETVDLIPGWHTVLLANGN